MEFEFNREKSSFIKVLKGKCEKNALKCSVEDNKIMIETFIFLSFHSNKRPTFPPSG